MLANFASPWNCIYSAAKLKEDPLFPQTHILGTGAFASSSTSRATIGPASASSTIS